MSGLPARALTMLRTEGLRGIGVRILAATVYRRLLVLALPLDDTRGPAAPSRVEIRTLEATALDEYLRFRPGSEEAALARRFRAGARCFVALHEGRIVHAGWATTGPAWIEYLGCEFPLAPGDVFQFDSFTAPEFRGRGFAQARITAMAGVLRAEGRRRLLAAVWPENTAGLRPLTAMGYRVVGRVTVTRLGPWRRVRVRGVHQGATQATDTAEYWDEVVADALAAPPIEAWRAYMRRVYASLVARWLPPVSGGLGLKTDLFEEAVSSHHLLSTLGPGSVGLDYSPAVVRAARKRLATGGGRHRFVVGDLRRIPLRTASMARILAGSSLDHFAKRGDLAEGLAELARVLAPGGMAILTFDNPENPLVWVRNHLPFSWLHRIGLVPYYVGHTYGRREARIRLEALGLTVTEVAAVAHAPRAPAIWLAAIGDRLGRPALSVGIGNLLWRFESLARWPTRFWTGYYVALAARKPDLPSRPS
jgi:SAM-dependent methyltransferase/GNAT superfamily N-acetyltransferase